MELKIGDTVKHKTTDDFEMVVIDFDTYWNNDMHKTVKGIPNPEFPICKYYNIHTNNWEQKKFNISELEKTSE